MISILCTVEILLFIWKHFLIQRERVENTSRPGEMQVTIQNLMPATVYIFRVVAQNKHGSGESSVPLRVETQPEGKSFGTLSPLSDRPLLCVRYRTSRHLTWARKWDHDKQQVI